jgi:hypothetical protein
MLQCARSRTRDSARAKRERELEARSWICKEILLMITDYHTNEERKLITDELFIL